MSSAVFKPADCARAASFDRIIKDNVFVLKDGESPMVSLATSDCIGVELADNKLFAGNGQIASGPAKPTLNQSNTALPLAAAPAPPSPYCLGQEGIALELEVGGYRLPSDMQTLVAEQPAGELPQLSQLGIKIGVIDSAKAVSFHHKTGHLAVGCISSAVVVWAN